MNIELLELAAAALDALVAEVATGYLLFLLRKSPADPAALIQRIAGRTEQNVGDPRLVAEATWALVQELLGAR
jgi:hypothetical protein